MSNSLRIVVIKDSTLDAGSAVDLIADKLGAWLFDAGYNVIATVPGDIDLPEKLASLEPDMIIIDADSSARDVLEHVVVATRDAPRPIVMFTDDGEPEEMRAAIAAGVSAYIVAGLQPQRVRPILEVALARFEMEQQLRAELGEVKQQLADRKLIERAKGLLMSKNGCTEAEAFQLLRRQAMDKNLKLVEVSQRVIDVAELLA